MATPRLTDELRWSTLGTWPFWRNLAVYFCAFSLVGHWLEIVYCTFMDLFGIVDEDSLVWDDPLYPFLVYGVGCVVCAVALLPLNILGQAWLVNDLVLGVVAMLYTWFVYPWCEKMLAHVPARAMNVIAIVVVVGFIVLCVVKFS